MTTLQEKLRAAREASGMSRAKLAKCTGISESTIEKLEYGERTPSLQTLKKICSATGAKITIG